MWPWAADTKSATNRILPTNRIMPPSVLMASAVSGGLARASIRDLQEDAAAAVAGFRRCLRLRCLLERVDVLDLGLQDAGRHQCAELLQDRAGLGGVAHRLGAHPSRGGGLGVGHADDGHEEATRLEDAPGVGDDLT